MHFTVAFWVLLRTTQWLWLDNIPNHNYCCFPCLFIYFKAENSTYSYISSWKKVPIHIVLSLKMGPIPVARPYHLYIGSAPPPSPEEREKGKGSMVTFSIHCKSYIFGMSYENIWKKCYEINPRIDHLNKIMNRFTHEQLKTFYIYRVWDKYTKLWTIIPRK